MRIRGLKEYQRRGRRGVFCDLEPDQRQAAIRILRRLFERWKGDLPQWRRAILIGQAKRLALNPPDSSWGRSMLARRGGYAVQRMYRMEGKHPTEKATRVRVLRRKSLSTGQARAGNGLGATNDKRRHEIYPWSFTPETVRKAHQLKTDRPSLPPPPSPEARRLHRQLDPPGCRCYYCAWPDHIEP